MYGFLYEVGGFHNFIRNRAHDYRRYAQANPYLLLLGLASMAIGTRRV